MFFCAKSWGYVCRRVTQLDLDISQPYWFFNLLSTGYMFPRKNLCHTVRCISLCSPVGPWYFLLVSTAILKFCSPVVGLPLHFLQCQQTASPLEKFISYNRLLCITLLQMTLTVSSRFVWANLDQANVDQIAQQLQNLATLYSDPDLVVATNSFYQQTFHWLC